MSDLNHRFEGELVAMTALLRAMIETHPNPELLRSRFEQKFQAALAATVPAPVKEEYLTGLQEQAERLWVGLKPT